MTEPGQTDMPPPVAAPAPTDRAAVLRWLLMVVAVGFVLSSIAPGLPPTWKRLGLMYAVLGGLIGAAAGWLAGRMRGEARPPEGAGATFPPPRRLIWLVLLATLGALVNTALVSTRQYRLAVEASAARDPRAIAYLEMLRSAAKSDPESAAQLEAMNRRMATGLRDYLAFRFSQLATKRLALPPEFLWGIEVALGLLASGVAFHAVSKRMSTPAGQA